MREIKFRAWHTHNKVMLQNENLSVLAKNIKDDTVWKFMQFTGLKDKNGVDIYFGDILATSNDNSQPFTEYDIWNKDECGYTVVLENKEELGVCYSDWSVENDLMSNGEYEKNSVYSLGFVEVVGNIYKNPDLLIEKL